MLEPTAQKQEAACRYAELGYKVFPCAPNRKTPITRHGCLDATTDHGQIEKWWHDRPEANVAIATDGLLVIDVDGKDNPWPGSPERAYDLLAAPLSLTPRGGSHRVFRAPAGKSWRCTESALAPKVDTRASGGYVVVPPSICGKAAYRWGEGASLDVRPECLPEPPAWLMVLVDQLAGGEKKATNGVPVAGNVIPARQRNSTLARLGGNMRRVGMTESEILAALLRANEERCQPPLLRVEVQRIAKSIARYEPDQVAVAVAENHWGQMQAEPDEAGSVEEPANPGEFPAHLIETAPEIVQECLDFYRGYCIQYQPVMFLGSLLAATGAVLGHKVQDVSGLRTNIYTLGIAPTGGGKEATRECAFRIFRAASLAAMCGPEEFASDAGVIGAVEKQNPILFQLDEFGRLMRAINADGVHNPHLFNISAVLLKFFSKANSVFRSKAYADADRNREIEQPHVCIYGTTVPTNFWTSLNAESVEGGFLPRMLIFEAEKKPAAGGATESEPPKAVSDFFASWGRRAITTGNLESQFPRPMVVPFSEEASRLMNEFAEVQTDEEGRYGNLGVIWSRAVENARKVAMIHACWGRPLAPRVDAVSADWAIKLITHAVRRCVYAARYNVAESTADDHCQRVLRVLIQARQEGHPEVRRHALCRQLRSLSRAQLNEALTTLREYRAIDSRTESTRGRSATLYWVVSGA